MSAIFSPDGRYRYRLDRAAEMRTVGLNRRLRALFVALNPSKAGSVVDGREITDPSATRMANFAGNWGYGLVTICNLWPLVATDPAELRRLAKQGTSGHREALGPCEDGFARQLVGDAHLRTAAAESQLIIACWGASYPPAWAGRTRYVRGLLAQYGQVHHLGLTQGGDPRHPLYLRGDTQPVPWVSA